MTGRAGFARKTIGIAVSFFVIGAMFPLVAQAAPPRRLSITDVSVIEGDAGAQAVSFTVSYTGKSRSGITVQYATANVSATGGADYTSVTGTASLPKGGCKCTTVTVDVLGDLDQEATETFQVNLSNPTGASIRDGVGVGTIFDNDGPPEIVILPANAGEADGSATFSVVLTSSQTGQVSVDFATGDATAVSGNDYTATSGTLIFLPGDVEETVPVTILDDAVAEDDETFTVDLSNAIGGTIAGPQAVGTIVSDDADPTVSVDDVALAEGDVGPSTASFTLSLSTASEKTVTITYGTSGAGATPGVDYTSTTATATFLPGDTIATVDVEFLGDSTFETDEDVALDLSDEDNVTIGDGQGLATIVNDDAPPVLSIGDVAMSEGDSGSTVATFTITKSGSTALASSASWNTADVTATGGIDYAVASGSLTLEAAETTTTAQVVIAGDLSDEADETFHVVLADPTNATLGDDVGVATIVDDDGTPTSLSLRVVRSARRVTARGVLEPADVGLQVRVTLLVRRDGRYRKIAVKTVTVASLGDRDGDTVTDAGYRARFRRPAHGRYMFRAVFAGNAELERSTKSVRFRL
jgi:Calx-beta domain-containing protein